ncbi:sulfur carrier protein ThiS [Thiohalophilus thiocyanatoxydans]|uniref:Sulfur carrier protein ThiS n=1 Tax=Thiohalophilus thiocyanatoxydans TaxID=381308 RepID=A0A4V3H3F9_9GAMM|nr:sulfur carrier protein ThiS [Thiohalophilus thiocyanatoxydans]TDX98163.1 sulfur carrier protein ThiS [Thiohalophilus thiocyanatoxydans]
MQIIVNGEQKQIEPGLTAAALVEQMGLGGRRIAMEVNQEILPRSRYGEHAFTDGDRVEIVHAVGGG